MRTKFAIIALFALLGAATLNGQQTKPAAAKSSKAGQGPAYVDKNNDGVCDNASANQNRQGRKGQGNKNGSCRYR